MKSAALILLLFAPVAFAHPLDDKAQMASEVVIVSDSRLEYVLHFRYLNVLASTSELDNGLDADHDSIVTAQELKRRFNALVDELSLAISISIDRTPVTLEPDFERFLFQNLERPGPLDLSAGVPTSNLCIHYKFVFTWDASAPLSPGSHNIEYWFNGLQSVVHTPAEQMVAFDARVEPRVRLADVKHTNVGIPKLAFAWQVAAPAVPPPANEPTIPFTTSQPTSEAEQSRTTAWLIWVLAGSGGASVTVLLVLLNRRRKSQHPA